MSIVSPTQTVRLEQQITGSNNNTWNDRYNANWNRVDAAFQTIVIDTTAADVTLTTADSSDLTADAQVRYFTIVAGGTPTTNRNIIWPASGSIIPKPYILSNFTAHPVTFKASGGSGVTLASGASCLALATNIDLTLIAN